jgi:YjjG family noncanonical pyrimidine nucleotidase
VNKPDFIYFDIDDTLLDHMSAQRAALENVYAEFPCLQSIGILEFQQAYKEANNRLWHLYSLGEIDRAFLEKHRFVDTFEKLGTVCSPHKDIAEFYINDYRSHWNWISGAKEALDVLAGAFQVGFITNGFSETQKLKVSDFALHQYSDKVIISEDVGFLKPSPEIFQHAELIAKTPSDRILYVGDSYTSDVVGGKTAGWKVAWLTHEKNGHHEIQPDFVFDDFSQLTKILIH